MIHRAKAILFIIIIFLAGSMSSLLAQNEFIVQKPGANALSLGGSRVGGVFDPSALFWNPAALGFVSCRQLYYNINDPFQFNYFAFSQFIPKSGTFGAAFLVPENKAQKYTTNSVGWGFKTYDNSSVGLSLNFHELNQLIYTTLNLGMLYQVPYNLSIFPKNGFMAKCLKQGILSFGAVAHNLPVSKRTIKHSIRFGMAYESLVRGLIFQANVHLQQPEPTFHLGAGARITRKFAILAGIQDFEDETLAMGCRFSEFNYAIDLSYANHTQTVQASFRITLGKTAKTLAREHIQKGGAILRNGDYRKALDEYQKALAYSANNDSIANLSRYLAQKQFMEELKIDSLYVIASKFKARQEYIKAAYHYLKILQINPYHKQARLMLAYIKPHVDFFIDNFIQQAKNTYADGDLKTAEKMLRAILVIREGHTEAQQLLTQISDSLKERAQEHYYRGWGYEKSKNYQRAKQQYELALEYDVNSEAIRERYQKLLQLIKDNEEQKEQQIDTYLSRARNFKRQKNFVQAFRDYERVLGIDPKHSEAQIGLRQTKSEVASYLRRTYNRARNFFDDQKFDQAESMFNDVARIAQLDSEWRTYLNNSNRYLRRINRDKNLECDQLYQRGLEFLTDQKWTQALDNFRRMKNLGCNNELLDEKYDETLSMINADSLRQNGRRHFEQGDYLEALDSFNGVLEVRPNDSQVAELREQCRIQLNEMAEKSFNQGLSYYVEEKYEQAIEMWEETILFNPDHQDAKDYKERAQKRIDALNKLR